MLGLLYPFAILADSITSGKRCARPYCLGGVFVGHFFGLRHSWASQEQVSFHSVEDVQT